MSNNEDIVIKRYKMDRLCKPHPDIDQLVLKKVDTTESVYTRSLVQLKDASLPDSVRYDSIEQQPTGVVSWDLFVMLKYRQDWVPSGYGLGELLYAISLMPNEELTLELKTWETSKTQQDEEQTLDERNVSDIKTASSTTSEVTTGEETKTHEYVDGKAGFSGFGFSASVAAGWSQDVSTMQKNFCKRTKERSTQATNECRATRKVKMAVSRESGSESKTTRKIKNINQAHTLNVNYYEVLREYEVQLTLYDISLVLLGAEANLLKSTGYQTWDGSWQNISLGQMIRLSRSAEWVQAFTDAHGVSPIQVLRRMWGAPLYDAAMSPGDENASITSDDREAFQNTMLQYVRPTPGWIEPDEKGALRWGYEVLPGQERALLEYLYPFLWNCPGQFVARALKAKMEPVTAYRTILDRHAEMTIPSFKLFKPEAGERAKPYRATSRVAPLNLAEADAILVQGLFYGKSLRDFRRLLSATASGIVDQFNDLRETIGVVTIDDMETWKVTLPTQGVYSDLALGICSGAEDFYEIQRQFDLEIKKTEIDKLKLEVEKLNLEKQLLEQGKSLSSVTITDPTDNTSVNLGIDVGKTPAEVEFKKTT